MSETIGEVFHGEQEMIITEVKIVLTDNETGHELTGAILSLGSTPMMAAGRLRYKVVVSGMAIPPYTVPVDGACTHCDGIGCKACSPEFVINARLIDGLNEIKAICSEKNRRRSNTAEPNTYDKIWGVANDAIFDLPVLRTLADRIQV